MLRPGFATARTPEVRPSLYKSMKPEAIGSGAGASSKFILLREVVEA